LRGPAIAILPLIFLAAAAAPQGDCMQYAGSGVMRPPLDFPGRPSGPEGAGQVLATLPGADPVCRPALPPIGQATILRNESADALHGLPAPEITLGLDEPRRAPAFQ